MCVVVVMRRPNSTAAALTLLAVCLAGWPSVLCAQQTVRDADAIAAARTGYETARAEIAQQRLQFAGQLERATGDREGPEMRPEVERG